MPSSDLLRTCVQALRRFTGAKAVSLYVPAQPGVSQNALLIHDGEQPAVPELADLATAREFFQQAEKQLVDGGDAGGALFLRQLESGSDGSRLVRVSSPDALPALLYRVTHQGELPPARRSTDGRDVDPGSVGGVWLALASESPGKSGASPWSRLDQDYSWLPALASSLAWYEQKMAALLRDPISGLYGRAHFQTLLREAVRRAQSDLVSLSILLINPDDFAVVNENFGSEAGDAVIREIAQRLDVTMRSKDLLARYSGAIFAVGLQGVGATVGEVVAEKAQRKLTEAPYRRGSVRLGFSVGLAAYQPTASDDPGESALELVRGADRALNAAKEAGGGQIVVWQRHSKPRPMGTIDRLTGIFTANLAKDYRNMLVLWDTVIVVSNTGDFEALVSKLVERLHASFKADRVGLFDWSDSGELRLIHGKMRSAGGGPEQLELSDDQRGLLDEARTLGLAGQTGLMYSESEDKSFCCVPLIARDQCLGALYVDGRRDAVTFDRSDSIFFRALAGQLAVTLDRARLADQERVHQEQERRRLRTELKELRRALQEARLVYRSAELDAILTTLRQVAPSDATLLITGESGTGKELLARTAHELSRRSKKPLVVVDCSVIAASLIDRELFGHEKGAFTGAEKPAAGRLAEADHGTLLLDEIGELPIEVQSKLLRFTQEKMFTPVGGTRTRRVDVRIIAVTNRDLGREVKAGRFRADLYYRLNVLHIEVPALRERPDDILFLSRHFLEKFSLQYQKGVQHLSHETEEWLRRYPWPGNVRELQNRIMQAVLLSETDEIGLRELKLDGSGREAAAPAGRTPATGGPVVQAGERAIAPPEAGQRNIVPAPATAGGDSGVASRAASGVSPGAVGVQPPHTLDQAWEVLGDALGLQIESILETGTPAPLGRWLAEDLILEAQAQSGGVLNQGAKLLGIPESTFRRRFRRAQAEAGFTQRALAWEAVRPLVAALLRSQGAFHLSPSGEASLSPSGRAVRLSPSGGTSGEDLLERARDLLLEQIAGRISPSEVATGAALMGVSQPTFRRWAAGRKERDSSLR